MKRGLAKRHNQAQGKWVASDRRSLWCQKQARGKGSLMSYRLRLGFPNGLFP